MKGYVECLLQVTGDAAGLNTFDKLFRSGKGPSWADRASDGAPRYSLHALFPVPEAIQRRGYGTAGHLWCGDFWDVPDDLVDMQAKRLLGKRYYRFYTPGGVPENVFLKASYAVNLFREGITGARQFERLMSKQTDEEALFGRLDLSSLIPGGVPDEVLSRDSRYQAMQRKLDACLADRKDTRALVEEMEQYRKALSALHSGAPRTIIRGKIPDSHICFLDEIFKASDGILNALLTALNERRYTNEGTTIDIPTISFFSASNEIPNFSNPEEKILKPLYDRFELKVVTEYVEDRAARLSVLKGKQARQGQLKPLPAALVTLDELEEMQQDVAGVAVPDSVNELMDDVLCELRGKGIHISDRKYFSYAPIAQAKAWLEGRDTVESSDLTILRHYLWTAPEERAVIQGTLERMCNDPLKDRLDGILASALESYEDFNQSVDAPAARRIGKLRDEYLRLYEQIAQMDAAAQNDGERQKIQDCLNEMEKQSQAACDAIHFSYVPLSELHDLKAG